MVMLSPTPLFPQKHSFPIRFVLMGTVGDRRRGEEKREDTNQAVAKKGLEGAKSGTNKEESKNRWLKLLEHHREKDTTVMTNWVGWPHITNSASVESCYLPGY